MNTITILGIIAASITVLGFLYTFYRHVKKNISNLLAKVDDIELSLRTKQRFLIPKDTNVVITENNRIIKLEDDETIIVDKVDNGIVFGKIFYNTLPVSVSIYNIGEIK